MAAKHDPISDGWEDVADDNLSVVSLSISEDSVDAPIATASADKSTNPSAATSADKSKDGISSSKSSVTIDYESLMTELEDTYDSSEEERESVHEELNLPEPFVNPFRDDSEDDETRLGDNLDVDMDPTFLVKVCTSTIKLIGEILSIVCFGSCRHTGETPQDVRKDVEDACKRLRSHLGELVPIMSGYSKYWDPEEASISLPIDPGLYEWITDLKVHLLGLQALLQNELNNPHSESGASNTVFDLRRYEKSLNESCDQIVGFIPIMKADYDNFQTAHLPLPEESAAEASDESEIRGRHRYSCGGPRTGHAQLRHEIYALKDQISACVQCLLDFARRQPKSADRQLYQVKDAYNNIKSTLEILLSNNASEWIDHGLSGGITFPEFYRLNLDTIKSLMVQLREIVERFTMEQHRVRVLRYAKDPDLMTDDDQEVQTTNIGALKDMQDVLEDLFQVKNKHSVSTDD
jgi:hypothetical protein